MKRSHHGRRSPARVPVLLVGIAALSLQARALERIELRNGFTYECVRTEALADGQVRLHLNAAGSGSGGDSYLDLAADRIVSVEHLPDPSPPLATHSLQIQTQTAQAIPDLLLHAGAAHNIDVALLASIVRAESGGHAAAVSHAGAQGLMQLMPGTARDLGVGDAFKPEDNINGGTAYLDALLSRYHDNLPLALAAYNAGPGAVDRFHGIPPYRETRAYVVRVLTEFKRRKAALGQTALADSNQ